MAEKYITKFYVQALIDAYSPYLCPQRTSAGQLDMIGLEPNATDADVQSIIEYTNTDITIAGQPGKITLNCPGFRTTVDELSEFNPCTNGCQFFNRNGTVTLA